MIYQRNDLLLVHGLWTETSLCLDISLWPVIWQFPDAIRLGSRGEEEPGSEPAGQPSMTRQMGISPVRTCHPCLQQRTIYFLLHSYIYVLLTIRKPALFKHRVKQALAERAEPAVLLPSPSPGSLLACSTSRVSWIGSAAVLFLQPVSAAPPTSHALQPRYPPPSSLPRGCCCFLCLPLWLAWVGND